MAKKRKAAKKKGKPTRRCILVPCGKKIKLVNRKRKKSSKRKR